MDIDLKQLKELMRSLKQFDISELEIEKNGERIKLARGGAEHSHHTSMSMMPSAIVASIPGNAPAHVKGEAIEDDASIHYITSPFVGTFYESPSPDSDPFVKVGSEIKTGQGLCIIEAMKLMNEIEADVSGTILEIIGENGKSVEYGDRLFKVKKKN